MCAASRRIHTRMSIHLSAAAADPNVITHIPTDIVDRQKIRATFIDVARALAASPVDESGALRSTRANTVILGWADALGAGHGGAAALLSSALTRFNVDVALDDGRTADTTFFRLGGRLGVNIVLLPRGPENLLMIENPDPRVGAVGRPASGPFRRAYDWLRGAR